MSAEPHPEDMSLEFEAAELDAMDAAADAAMRRAHAELDEAADAWRFADP